MATTQMISPVVSHKDVIHKPQQKRETNNNDDEPDYVEMTPTDTPVHSYSKPPPHLGQSLKSIHSLSKIDINDRGINFHEDQENKDYEDMSGVDDSYQKQTYRKTPVKSPYLNQYRLSMVNRSSQEQPNHSTHRKHLVSSKSVDCLVVSPYASKQPASNCQDRFEMCTHEEKPRSFKNTILVGGFNKNDDDDYTDIHTLPKSAMHRNKSSRQSTTSPNHKNQKSLSTSLLTSTKPEQKIKDIHVRFEENFRKRSNGISVKSSSCQILDRNTSSKLQTTDRVSSGKTAAGLAAKKLLQSQLNYEKENNKMNEVIPSGSAGVKRSVSRTGRGVQSRINKNRQHSSLKEKHSQVFNDISENHHQDNIHQKIKQTEVFELTDDKTSKDKERQLISKKLYESLDRDSGNSFLKGLKPGSDGAKLLKLITEGQRSKSLDKNYMEWIAKTTPYMSRTSSTTSSTSEKDVKKLHSTSELLSSGSFEKFVEVESNDVLEKNDEEAFKQYLQSISRHQENEERRREKEKKKQASKSNFWGRSKKEKSKSIQSNKSSNANNKESFENTKSKSFKRSLKSKKSCKKSERENCEETSVAATPCAEQLNNIIEIDKDENHSQKETINQKDITFNTMEHIDRKSITLNSTSINQVSANDSLLPNATDTVCLRTRASTSIISPKKASKRHSASFFGRMATVPQLMVTSSPSQKVDLSHHYSKNNGHRRNKSDIADMKISSTSSSLQASLIDISLESNYENDNNVYLIQPSAKTKQNSLKSNTLGRFFGRKKERSTLDYGKLSGGLEDLIASKRKNSDGNTHNKSLSVRKDLFGIALKQDCASVYMNQSFLVHGFAFDRPQTTKTIDRDWKSRTMSSINKYATTGSKTSLTSNKSFQGKESPTSPPPDNKRKKSQAMDEDFKRNERMNESDYDDIEVPFPLSDSGSCIDFSEKVLPLWMIKNERTMEMAAILLFCIKSSQPDIFVSYNDTVEDTEDVADSQSNPHWPEPDEFLPVTYAKGKNLVAWLQRLIITKQKIDERKNSHFKALPTPTRKQIGGMWQVLLEEGAICHVRWEEHFEDSDYYYAFHKDVVTEKLLELNGELHSSNGDCKGKSMETLLPYWIEELEISDVLSYLRGGFHDAMFRKALRKDPSRRTVGELKMIYDELIHFNSITHLSDSVKRELARVVRFEHHADEGKILFNQGDEGTCWYIILHGSVEVDVNGKGIVCTLQDGEDFGNLSLMNEAPRSATITLAEPDCHFIRVDKSDYFRILKDVEENTMRLKEHGKDVLILEKVSCGNGDQHEKMNGTSNGDALSAKRRAHSYSITAGTPERILEHILEYLQPWKLTFYDETLENFILMFATFMKSDNLFKVLLERYKAEDMYTIPFDRSMKRRIVYFIIRWSYIVTYLRQDDVAANNFLKDLEEEIRLDCMENPAYAQLKDEFLHLYQIEPGNESKEDLRNGLFVIEETVKRYQSSAEQAELHRPLRSNDETLIKVYNSAQTYTTVKLSLQASAEDVIAASSEKLSQTTNPNLNLVEVMETGDRVLIPKDQRSVATAINLNSVLYISEERDSFEVMKMPRPLPGSQKFHFDDVSSLEIAYFVTQYDWHLLNNIHVLEYVYKVFGARKFQRITPNLDVLARRFNQLAYWPPTEICTCQNINKRAMIIRKFIKIAQHLKRYQNMNAFMAVMIGIGNQSVSRLSATWEKLPTKYRKMVHEFETILDPSRNHHNYRVFASTMEPPYIPYFPLLMKDMTFQHEGNENQKEELVNFEKMHMISSSIRTIIRGCLLNVEEDGLFSSTKTSAETKKYVQSMTVISDQRYLNELSAQLEPKR